MESNETTTIKNLTIDNDGNCQFHSQDQLRQAVDFLMKIKMAPDSLVKAGPQAVASALMLCKQSNLPQKAMNQMAYIRGKIEVFGSLPLALAMKSPEFDDFKTLYIDLDGEVISYKNKNLNNDVYACVCLVKKKSREEYNEYFFTLDDAKRAGLLRSPTWSSFTKDMLYHKAKARALTREFPDQLDGFQVQGLNEYEDPSSDKEMMKTFNTKEEIKSLLSNKD